MKRYILQAVLILVCTVPTVCRGEDPYFKIEDPAIYENFRRAYSLIDQHRHDNIDSSRLYDVIPDSGSTYDLGSASYTWRRSYVEQAVILNRTAAQIKTLVAFSSGVLVYNLTDFELYYSTGTPAGSFKNTRTGEGP